MNYCVCDHHHQHTLPRRLGAWLSGFPTGTGFSNDVRSTYGAFTACRPADGSLVSWGGSSQGQSGFPTGTGFSNDVRVPDYRF